MNNIINAAPIVGKKDVAENVTPPPPPAVTGGDKIPTPFHLSVAYGKREAEKNTFYPDYVFVEDMATLLSITKNDHTPAKFKNNKRCSVNFESADVAVFDVDNPDDDPNTWIDPAALIEALPGIEMYFVASRNYMKSKNGKPPRPRFHIYVPVSRFDDAKKYAAFLSNAIDTVNTKTFGRFVFDRACKDAARPFFGSVIDVTFDAPKTKGENPIQYFERLNVAAEPVVADRSLTGGSVGSVDRKKSKAANTIPKGKRRPTMQKFAHTCLNEYPDDEEKAHAAFIAESKKCLPPMDNKKLSDVWEFAKTHHKKTDEAYIDENGKLIVHEFARVLKRKFHAKVVDEAILVYDDDTGEYVHGGDATEGIIIRAAHEMYIPLTIKEKREVYESLRTLSPILQPDSNANLILFANGILDVTTWKLMPFSPDIYVTNRIPFNYKIPKANAKVVDTFLSDITKGDADMKAVLTEAVGAAMSRRVWGKAYWLSGNGNNGKSVFLKVLEHILGRENYSAVPMDLWNEKFKNASLEGKTANIVHEAGSTHIKDTTYIKSCIRGETIDVEQKNCRTRKITPYFTSFTASNEMPIIGYAASQKAIAERFLFIPFDAHFEAGSDADDPDILEKLTTPESIEAFIFLGVMGLRRLMDNKGKHTTCRRIEDAVKKRLYDADSIGAWIYEAQLKVEDFEGKTTASMYEVYTDYCKEEGITPRSRRGFTTYVGDKFRLCSGVIRIGTVIARGFMRF